MEMNLPLTARALESASDLARANDLSPAACAVASTWVNKAVAYLNCPAHSDPNSNDDFATLVDEVLSALESAFWHVCVMNNEGGTGKKVVSVMAGMRWEMRKAIRG